ncbi:MAG: GNAT family N-acetyltransferase [Vicinamibacterales bacterium]
MFTSQSLARRIERAEVSLVVAAARAAARRVPAVQLLIQDMCGGAAVFVERGAPFNKVVGVGFEGVPAAEVLDRLEQDFADRQAPLSFEVSTLADPALMRTLTARGYLLTGFEHVLGLPLNASTRFDPVPGVEVLRAGDEESAVWMDVVATGFEHPELDGPTSQPPVPRDVLERVFGDTMAAPGFERYLARRGGVVAGGATFRIEDGVAQLSGAATLPAHRRHGVQSALLRHRLAEAVRRGCDIAVVTTEPGSTSQQNGQAAGFALLYARAVLVKEPSAVSRQPSAVS